MLPKKNQLLILAFISLVSVFLVLLCLFKGNFYQATPSLSKVTLFVAKNPLAAGTLLEQKHIEPLQVFVDHGVWLNGLLGEEDVSQMFSGQLSLALKTSMDAGDVLSQASLVAKVDEGSKSQEALSLDAPKSSEDAPSLEDSHEMPGESAVGSDSKHALSLQKSSHQNTFEIRQ